MSDTNTARERLLDVMSFTECANGGTTPEALLAEYDAARRAEVLAEGAALVLADAEAKYQRSYSDNRIFEFNGGKRAADLLLAARATTAPTTQEH